jgi:hypothetical protein
MDGANASGWRISSDVPLPDTLRWWGSEGESDLEIRCAPTLAKPADAVEITPLFSQDREGSLYFDLPQVGLFRLTDGHRVAVSQAPHAHPADLRTILLGPVMAALYAQCRMMSLSATAVLCRGTAVVICGASGTGKSTIAASLAARGYPLLSDGLVIPGVDDNDGVVFLPTLPQTVLWRDTLNALHIPAAGLMPNRVGQEKYRYSFDAPYRGPAVPAGKLLILIQRRSRSPEPPTPLEADDALNQLSGLIDQSRIAQNLGQQDMQRAFLTFIARKVPAFRSSAPFQLAPLTAYIDRIEEMLNE